MKDEYFFTYSATFRVFGDTIDSEEITGALGVIPTYTHKRGEVGLLKQKHQFDAWFFKANVDRQLPLEAHLLSLWETLEKHKAYLINLKNHYELDVFCTYSSNCSTGGIRVNHHSLKICTELEVPLEISIVVSANEIHQALAKVK
jgi:Domain of unknown function (DUF4279)